MTQIGDCFSGGNGGSNSGGASGGSINIETQVAHIGGKNFRHYINGTLSSFQYE